MCVRMPIPNLNFAGMLAPVVAIAPTTDIGRCWSVAPNPLPVKPDGSVAEWVVTNIDNNYYGLLIAGAIGLVVAAIIAIAVTRNVLAPVTEGRRGTRVSLLITAVVLLLAWWLIQSWEDFNTRAHGWAAVLMFGFLILAIIANVREQRQKRNVSWSLGYLVVAGLMILGAIIIPWSRIFGDHTVFALEAWEIALFAVYWLVQTKESWQEEVTESVGG